MRRFLKSYWPFAILIAAIAVVFSPTWGKFVVLPSPDSSPGEFTRQIFRLNECLSGLMTIDFYSLLEVILPPYTFCDITYPIDTFLIAVGLAWFLRARGLGRTAAAVGGGIFALMGYSLTLVSAGHRGFFYLTVNMMFLYAFFARGLAGGRLANYALAGVCAAWGLRHQPDFAAIYLILLAIYGICAIIHQARSIDDRGAFFKRLGKGVALTAATFALCVIPIFRSTLLSSLQGRQETIGESGEAQAEQADAEKTSGETLEEELKSKWFFTTNWSLPPDEALEFVAPSVKGRQTGDQTLPYWGRLGQTWKWEETHQGFMNYRQHLVYLGVVPLMMALLAVLTVLGPREEGGLKPTPPIQAGKTPEEPIQAGKTPEEPIQAGRTPTSPIFGNLRFDVWFWGVVWVVALLLAFGRYTPFYKLFYALPYVSLMRAPVKFVRLVELATAILAAIGAQAFLESGIARRQFRRFAAVSGILFAIFAIFTVTVSAKPSIYLSPLVALGADERLMAAMSANAVNALLHAVIGLAVVAAVAWWRGRDETKNSFAPFGLAVLFVAAVISAAVAERPFAAANDIEFKYTSRNPVTQMALESGVANGHPAVWSAVQSRFHDYALKQNLICHGVDDAPHDFDQRGFFANAGNDAFFRAMELSGCQYAIVPASQAKALPKGRFEPVCGLALRNPPALFEKTMAPGKDDYLLARVVSPLPDAQFFTRWAPTTYENLMRDVALKMRGDWSQWTLPVVDAPDTSPEDAKMPPKASQAIKSVLALWGARKTLVEVDAPANGYLLLRWGYWERNAAWVDGKMVPQLRAGYNHTAIFVPAGRHTVEFSNIGRSPAWTPVLAIVLVAFAIGFVREAI